jgi:hypothetical protein
MFLDAAALATLLQQCLPRLQRTSYRDIEAEWRAASGGDDSFDAYRRRHPMTPERLASLATPTLGDVRLFFLCTLRVGPSFAGDGWVYDAAQHRVGEEWLAQNADLCYGEDVYIAHIPARLLLPTASPSVSTATAPPPGAGAGEATAVVEDDDGGGAGGSAAPIGGASGGSDDIMPRRVSLLRRSTMASMLPGGGGGDGGGGGGGGEKREPESSAVAGISMLHVSVGVVLVAVTSAAAVALLRRR